MATRITFLYWTLGVRRWALGVCFLAVAFLTPTLFASFNYDSPVTVDHTKVPSTQTDFPVLISQTDNRFKTVANGGHVQSSSGYDIRPYSDSALTTALSYELERYNASTGEVIMWVKVGSLSSSIDTVIYLAYGNAALTTDGSSTATWSNNFTGVYHFKDGTTLNTNDSTANAHNLTSSGSPTATTGQIDGGVNYASASSQFSQTDNGVATVAMSYSVWAKGTSFPNSYNTVTGYNSLGTIYFIIYVKSNGKLAVFQKNGAPQSSYDGTGGHTLSTGTWYHVAATYDSTSGLIGYVNGSQDNTAAATVDLSTNSGLHVYTAEDPQNTGDRFNGPMDELRISSVARSANWIATEYNSGNPGTFETLGTEGVPPPSSSPANWFFFFR